MSQFLRGKKFNANGFSLEHLTKAGTHSKGVAGMLPSSGGGTSSVLLLRGSLEKSFGEDFVVLTKRSLNC